MTAGSGATAQIVRWPTPVHETAGIRMLVDSTRTPRGTDAVTGWSCFR